MKTMAQPPLKNVDRFLNRELSLLAFNERVLAMSEDPSVPALEKLKYICIVSSNLDELFEIRVAGIKAQLRNNPDQVAENGTTAADTFREVSARAHALITHQYEILNTQIFPLLEKHGIHFHLAASLNSVQREWAHQYFSQEVLPVLTPIGLSPTHPFPRVLNKSLNFVLELEGQDSFGRESGIAVVQAPRALPRLVAMPKEISGHEFG
ncbi:MAG: RNA degradosome polyphosphate kinase, partial [Burkholderiaceae bacterium]